MSVSIFNPLLEADNGRILLSFFLPVLLFLVGLCETRIPLNGGSVMTLLYTLCGIIVAFLFVYLVVALLKPEMFP